MDEMSEFSSLEDQLRECFGRVVYAHKTHEKMADRSSNTLRRFKLTQIVLSALTACGAVSIVFVDSLYLKIATAGISFITLFVSGYMKSFDPGGTAQKHRDTAASLWPLRESYFSLLTDLRMQAITHTEALKQREELQRKLAAVYKGAPQTDADAYANAKQALEVSEEFTFSDAEIDRFMPASLKKTE